METKKLFAITSALLQYPDESLLELAKIVATEVETKSDSDESDIAKFLEWLESDSLLSLQSYYVSVFDRKRRACLYLSYYLNGDTRTRGMALVHFKEMYRASGFTTTDDELPDFLPTVLQFTAAIDLEVGLEMLSQHYAGLVVLNTAMLDLKSPYSNLTSALVRHVPEGENPKVDPRQLITIGVPTELVGLEPFSLGERAGK